MPQPTISPLPPITRVVEDSMRSMTQGIEATVKASFDVQQALVESTVSIIRASFAANKSAVDQLLALGKQQQPGLISVLENSAQTWAGMAERTVAATEQAVDRATEKVDAAALQVDAAALQLDRVLQEQQREEAQPRVEQQQGQPADEPQAADRPAINVVKREDDWAVVRDNASRASGTFDTKREAVERAHELAQRSGADVHVETATDARPEQQPRQPADEPQAADRPAINVVKREDDWAVVRDNASRASGTFDTKREAVKRARELAQRSGADVHVETATDAQPERNGAGEHR